MRFVCAFSEHQALGQTLGSHCHFKVNEAFRQSPLHMHHLRQSVPSLPLGFFLFFSSLQGSVVVIYVMRKRFELIWEQGQVPHASLFPLIRSILA